MDDRNAKEVAIAIQELAKLSRELINPVSELGKAMSRNEVGDIARALYAAVGGYVVSEWAIRNHLKHRKKTLEYIEENSIPVDPSSLPPRFGIKWIRASLENDQVEIQDMLSRLLARAMDPTFTHRVEDRFVDVVNRFTAADALLFQQLYSAKPFPNCRGYSENPGLMNERG